MSAITSDWAPIKTAASTPYAARRNRKVGREEEFHAALDSYIADYRRNLAQAAASSEAGGRRTTFNFFRGLAGRISR